MAADFNMKEISHVEMPAKEESSTSGTSSKSTQFGSIGLKFIELILIIFCIGLIDDPVVHSAYRGLLSLRTIALCYATFGAFLIYTVIFILSKLFREITFWKTSATWSLVGFILFVTCAALLLREWTNIKERNYWHPNTQRLDFICAVGSIFVFTALVFLIDMLLTITWGVRGDID